MSMLAVLIFVIVYKFRSPTPKGELEKALLELKLVLITVGFLTAVLWFMLPFTHSLLNPPVLSEAVGPAEANERILTYANDISLAVDRIRWVLHFFFLIFITGFFGAVYQVIKASGYLKNQAHDEPDSI